MTSRDDFFEKEAIRELRYAYSAHIDARAFDRLAALFAPDAVCEFDARFGGDWIGRDAIRANYETAMKAFGAPFDIIHVVTNPYIWLDSPDRAYGRWYLLDCLNRQKPHAEVESIGGHQSPFFCIGVYEDQYMKRGGEWLFARVKLHFLWPERSFEGFARDL